MATIVVTGGTGYIGSHTVVELINAGYDVVSIDNYISSDGTNLDGIQKITGKAIQNFKVDLCDEAATEKVFDTLTNVTGIIHFAALKMVPESMKDPLLYYHNNLSSLTTILKMVELYKIPNFIFSSSCSVYGNPDTFPVDENSPIKPAVSPYAHTKQIGEEMIRMYHGIKTTFTGIMLRYFNPIGSHPMGVIGEKDNFNNVMPLIMHTLFGRRAEFVIAGNDFPTRDGTAIRDYIHVSDIAMAHVQALKYAEQQSTPLLDVFNLGSESGVSVLELVKAVEAVNYKPFKWSFGPRRGGDPAAVYSNCTKAKTTLKWHCQYGITDMITSAIKWEEYLASKK